MRVLNQVVGELLVVDVVVGHKLPHQLIEVVVTHDVGRNMEFADHFVEFVQLDVALVLQVILLAKHHDVGNVVPH